MCRRDGGHTHEGEPIMTAFNWRTRARAIALAGVGIALVSA